jgi:DNA-directed RNA polymerase I subunit RPA2
MYSGITGEEFAADIYIGVVYYQRLRHMVLDKFQVRTTGPVDPVTRQPVKVRVPAVTEFRTFVLNLFISGA